MKKILAVIPARGGSKGLPRKNILPFHGKPLLAWSIDAAKASANVTRCLVSSEDDEILSVAREYGAEPLRRPLEFSGDTATSVEVVTHALGSLAAQGESFDAVLLLQPTSPLRTGSDIDAACDIFWERGLPCCVSVCSLHQSPFLSYTMNDGILYQLMHGRVEPRRQLRPEVFAPNGGIYLVDTAWFMENANFMASGATSAYEMPPERSIDIDTRLDFAMAEFLMSYNNN
ncbi:acylneuraminate cytidylyltransferase family protein [Desulfovibrio sp. OttesenSCG-928-C06]|nr:acylneuraminate cytidylyltransferase family protein [Desulfovibrio sp. OttesenSCG-928-C06]